MTISKNTPIERGDRVRVVGPSEYWVKVGTYEGYTDSPGGLPIVKCEKTGAKFGVPYDQIRPEGFAEEDQDPDASEDPPTPV